MAIWSGVYESLTSGNLGLPPKNPVGAILAVGPCSGDDENTVYLYGKADVKAIRGELGYGDLPDRLHDYFSLGGQKCRAIVVPAEKDVAGSIGAVTHAGTGTAVGAAAGTPTGTFQVRIQIVAGGAPEEATFKYSYDNGESWSSAITTPALDAAYTLGVTGATITFSDAYEGEGSFVAGDTYAFETVGPACSLEAILAALDAGVATKLPFEYACVMTPTGDATWDGLEAWADDLFDAHQSVRVLTEAPPPAEEDESYTTTALGYMDAYGKGDRVSICIGRGPILDLYGKRMRRGISGLVAGLIAASEVHKSIGRTAYCQMKPLQDETDLGSDGNRQALDTARFLVPRQYEGLSGWYVNNGNIACQDISDFDTIEKARVMDNAIRAVRLTALKYVHEDVNVVDGAIDEAGIAMIEGACQGTLDGLKTTFVSGTITVPAGQDPIATESLAATIAIVPKRYAKAINLTFGLARE
jgi:hypothetical protein